MSHHVWNVEIALIIAYCGDGGLGRNVLPCRCLSNSSDVGLGETAADLPPISHPPPSKKK